MIWGIYSCRDSNPGTDRLSDRHPNQSGYIAIRMHQTEINREHLWILYRHFISVNFKEYIALWLLLAFSFSPSNLSSLEICEIPKQSLMELLLVGHFLKRNKKQKWYRNITKIKKYKVPKRQWSRFWSWDPSVHERICRNNHPHWGDCRLPGNRSTFAHPCDWSRGASPQIDWQEIHQQACKAIERKKAKRVHI